MLCRKNKLSRQKAMTDHYNADHTDPILLIWRSAAGSQV
jgi:hypothetical protein